ncbi:DUF6512 family protein [Flavonifractor sp. An306]|uniref:DUF6512 family protein n=1 Tax=Flavonifractor sp. An306 TaxID=1965629 RepID=UPI000B39FD37|nr:DUF6512 family protein [Flavonifractor sp. An306]OUO39482.1 hypothetical protein B5F88_09445 [Flavonifractor sp. An306]
MSRLSRSVLLAFAAAVVAGTCLHFVYDLFPCPVTALFAPVSESIWEHSKLIYWPALVAGLLLERRNPGLLGQRAASLLLAVGVMLALGWLYHIPLGGEALLVDIALYVLSMGIAFFPPGFLPGDIWSKQKELFLLLVAALGAVILVFTFLPPAGLLFTDLSGANTWSSYPY